QDSLLSLESVLRLGVDGLKIHPLHVVKGTRLANQWRRGNYVPLELEEYLETVVEMVRRTPREVVYHRLTGTASENILLAPGWCNWKWRVLNAITRRLEQLEARQGDRAGDSSSRVVNFS
ncbi:MAG TPA: TIGR01212 family radical SAM protein, partial [Chromatiaceae bacterium]|nr:TIGR01212 family radical SAM protein [Chromatiaceae bacterium]